jgi:hypothetical protein
MRLFCSSRSLVLCVLLDSEIRERESGRGDGGRYEQDPKKEVSVIVIKNKFKLNSKCDVKCHCCQLLTTRKMTRLRFRYTVVDRNVGHLAPCVDHIRSW